jgi:hypothetical protein
LPKGSQAEEDEENDVLYYQHLSPHFLGIRAVHIAYVSKGPARACGKNYDDAG